MAITIRSLLVDLGVKTDEAELVKFDKALSAAKVTMAAAATVAVALTAALIGVSLSAAVAGDEIDKGAQRLAVSTEEFQRLRFAADRSGVPLETLGEGMSRLGAEAAKTGKKLKPNIELLKDVAEEVFNAKTKTEQAAIATKAFGESSRKLLPILREGRAGIEALGDEFASTGALMDEAAVRAAVGFTDRMTDLKAVLVGVKNTIGTAFLPVFSDLIETFVEWRKANADIINERLTAWVKLVAKGLKLMAGAVKITARVVEKIGIDKLAKRFAGLLAVFTIGGLSFLLAALPTILAALTPPLVAGASAAIAFLAPFAATAAIIAAVGVALIALGLIIEDFIVFAEGGDSVIGDFVDAFENAGGVLGVFATSLNALGPNFKKTMADLKFELGDMLRVLFEFLSGSMDRFLVWTDQIAAGFADAFDISKHLANLKQAAGKALGRFNPFGGGAALGGGGGAASSAIGSTSSIGSTTSSSSSTSNSFQGGGVTITGVGMTAADAERVAGSLMARERRQAATAFAGGEV